jgi:hypothetical protein
MKTPEPNSEFRLYDVEVERGLHRESPHNWSPLERIWFWTLWSGGGRVKAWRWILYRTDGLDTIFQ